MLALVAAILYAVGVGTPGGEPVALAGDSVAVVEAESGTIATEIPVGGRPGGVAVGARSVWVGNRDDRTLLRIDPRSRSVVRRIGLPITPDFVKFGVGTVWIGSTYEGRVVRVDPDVNSIVGSVALPREPGGCCLFGLDVGDNAVWASSGLMPGASRLWRIGLRTMAATPAGRRSIGRLAVGPDAVWGVATESIVRIDPAARTVVDVIRPGRLGRVADCQALEVADDGTLWVANLQGRTVWMIDPSLDRVSEVFPLGHRPIGIAIRDGAAWVATADKNLFRIDLRSRRIRRIALGVYASAGLAIDDDALWLAVTRI
jgi:streptogramin lyase